MTIDAAGDTELDMAHGEILAAIDERPGATVVLRWAGHLARTMEAGLRVVRSWEYPWVAGLPGVGPLPSPEAIDHAVEADLRSLVEEVLGTDTHVEVTVARGGAGQAVLAEIRDTSLVVMGRRGEDDQPRWLGSVSRKVLERSPVPVAVVPPDWESVDLDLIMAGVDFSDTSSTALRWAAELARTAGGRLLALHASARDIAGGGAESDEVRLLTLARDLAPEGIPLEAIIDERSPARAVVEVAAERSADLVVVGRRGAGGLPDTVLGTVATYAARHAPCPVVAIPS